MQGISTTHADTATIGAEHLRMRVASLFTQKQKRAKESAGRLPPPGAHLPNVSWRAYQRRQRRQRQRRQYHRRRQYWTFSTVALSTSFGVATAASGFASLCGSTGSTGAITGIASDGFVAPTTAAAAATPSVSFM